NGNNFDLKQNTAANRPVFSNTSNLTNFNPTITFNGANTWLDYLVSENGEILDRSTGTIFAAGQTINNAGAIIGFGPNLDYPGLYVTAPNKLTFLGSSGGNWATNPDDITNVHFIGGGGWLNGAGPFGLNLISTSLNGHYLSHDDLHTFDTNTSVIGDLRLGRDGNYNSFVGQENELIVFDTKLTDEEMNRVESYLAIKWGQTLSKEMNRNYLDSDGTIIWDAVENEDYHHNILGVGRDDVSVLLQKQSKSVNPGQKLIFGVGMSLADTNAANIDDMAFIDDKEFIIIGDNGLAQSLTELFTGNFPTGININTRFGAIWKVQNTGVSSMGSAIAWPKTEGLYLVT